MIIGKNHAFFGHFCSFLVLFAESFYQKTMDIKEIQALIKFVSTAGVDEVEINQKDFKLLIKKNPAQFTTAQYTPAPVAMQAAPAPVAISAPVAAAMKLFNEIESEVTGKIVKILVDNASPVEYDQPLFLVEPA